VATADNDSPAVSARRRSNPVQNCAPHICACANTTRNSPADRPQSRRLIAPTASSNAPATPNRPTSSATATTPEAGVNDASGAPTRTRPAKPGIFFTERVSFPQRPIGVSATPIVPAGKAPVRLCHATLFSYPRIRVRYLIRWSPNAGRGRTGHSYPGRFVWESRGPTPAASKRPGESNLRVPPGESTTSFSGRRGIRWVPVGGETGAVGAVSGPVTVPAGYERGGVGMDRDDDRQFPSREVHLCFAVFGLPTTH